MIAAVNVEHFKMDADLLVLEIVFRCVFKLFKWLRTARHAIWSKDRGFNETQIFTPCISVLLVLLIK